MWYDFPLVQYVKLKHSDFGYGSLGRTWQAVRHIDFLRRHTWEDNLLVYRCKCYLWTFVDRAVDRLKPSQMLISALKNLSENVCMWQYETASDEHDKWISCETNRCQSVLLKIHLHPPQFDRSLSSNESFCNNNSLSILWTTKDLKDHFNFLILNNTELHCIATVL